MLLSRVVFNVRQTNEWARTDCAPEAVLKGSPHDHSLPID